MILKAWWTEEMHPTKKGFHAVSAVRCCHRLTTSQVPTSAIPAAQ